MKRVAFGFIVLAAALVTQGNSGCAYFPQSRGVRVDTTAADFNPTDAWVFVENRNMGVTPTTIKVRRGFATTDITLRSGPKLEVIRRYEVELATTQHRSAMDFSFGSTAFGGIRGFDAADLPRDKKGTIIIPYYDQPIQVEDRDHRLTIIVEN